MKTYRELQEASKVPQDAQINILRGQIHTFRQNFLKNMEDELHSMEMSIAKVNASTDDDPRTKKFHDKELSNVNMMQKNISQDMRTAVSIMQDINKQAKRVMK